MPQLPTSKEKEGISSASIRLGGDLLGYGIERDVYEMPKDRSMTIGLEIRTTNPDVMKANFYLGNILHELFPEHFPKIFLASGGEKTQMQMENLPHQTPHPNDQAFHAARADMLEKLRQIGVPERVLEEILRDKIDNFGWHNEVLVYLDRIPVLNAQRMGYPIQNSDENMPTAINGAWTYRTYYNHGKDEPLHALNPDMLSAYTLSHIPDKADHIMNMYQRYVANVAKLPILPPGHSGFRE